VLWTAQGGILPVGRRVGDQARVDKPTGEGTQGDLRLDAGEGSADTVVDATAEAEMLVVGTFGIEPVRVWEARRVVAPGGKQEHHGRALWDGHSGNRDIGQGGARTELHRWIVAQHLLDQRDHEVGVAPQPLEDVGVAQQGEHAVGDQVDRGSRGPQ